MESYGEQLLEAVLGNAPVGLAFVDRDHVLVQVNPAFEAVTRLSGFDDVFAAAADDIESVFATGTPVVSREVAIADMQLLLSHYPVIVDDAVRWVGTIATDITTLRRVERERVDLLDAERRARSAAERMAVRLARLQAVTARLTAAADADEIAAVVCDHGAAGLGAVSGALMLLVDDGTAFEMVRQTGYSPRIEETYKRFPADAPLPACDAVRARSMVLLGSQAERDRRYPALVSETMSQLAHAVVPLLFGESVLGAVSFSFTDERSFDDDDRRFMLALASQASQALERARLHEAERGTARRQELLAEASRLLSLTLASSDTLRTVARLLVQDLADGCSVQLVEDNELRLVAAVHGDPEREAEVLRSGIGDTGTGRMLTLPLVARGVEVGSLLLSRDVGRAPFDANDVRLANDVANRVAVAVDIGRAQRAREEQAQTLQASLLPPRLPEIPGLTIDSRYQPVGDGSLVGGDFYDVFPWSDGRWGLMMGDVCGQGVVAASLTSLVRFTARAAARQSSSPAEVLRFTNTVLADHDLGERFCTVLLAAIAPNGDAGATVTVASGGHHLPLVHHPGAPVRAIGANGSALGFLPDPAVTDVTEQLEAGDTLVLYTDGVIEARQPDGEPVDDGFLERLITEHAHLGASGIGAAVERTVLGLGGGRARDDMAVLVVGVGPPVDAPSPSKRTFEQRYTADVESVTAARAGLRDWLETNWLVPARHHDLLVALTELTTNAVRSARTAVEVRAWTTPDAVTVEVTDDGPGFDPVIPTDARELDPLAERGRGLFLVAAVADECTIESGPNGTIVRCAVARSSG